MLEYVNIVFSFPHLSLMPRVGNFRQKNYSAEDGKDEANGYTVFTTEFQMFRRTENYQNSLPNHSAEERIA
jgi:hypothetical protein